ncbi:MAG: hypothetical protein J2P28_20790 [Actinobacteria bacterium]|nr:hypothetical protein [Actinomycetota bacterium]
MGAAVAADWARPGALRQRAAVSLPAALRERLFSLPATLRERFPALW